MANNETARWNFDNTYVRLLHSFYQKIKPTPVQSPSLVIFNEKLAISLDLNVDELNSTGVQIFAGNTLPEGSEPIAQAYAGHQFGHFTMLGDGRAILLGEQITLSGDRYDIQLKGAGRTPYSRGGDGRAALGPMLREYIISEAMHGLKIPTTRSLAVVKTGEGIIRETILPGAILTRVATSHIRVGTFEYAARFCPKKQLQILADYTIKRHFPHISVKDEDRYLQFFQEVMKKQAKLISQWQLVGFIHGVMNTDNMTISGETIDYGPCAFMNEYDPKTVFSSIDTYGRYAYGNQPPIALWNLARFAETLLPLFHEDEKKSIQIAEDLLSKFMPEYEKNWLDGIRRKIGLSNEEDDDLSLIEQLFEIMEKYKADFTNTFRSLTLAELEKGPLFQSTEFSNWHKKWNERLTRQPATKEDVHALMKRTNPAIIPRNHKVEEALEAAVNNDDFSLVEKLVSVLAQPFIYSKEQEEYCTLPPKSDEPYRTFCGT